MLPHRNPASNFNQLEKLVAVTITLSWFRKTQNASAILRKVQIQPLEWPSASRNLRAWSVRCPASRIRLSITVRILLRLIVLWRTGISLPFIAYNILNFPHFQIHPPGAVRTAFSMLLFYHFYAVLYSGGCFSFAESGYSQRYQYKRKVKRLALPGANCWEQVSYYTHSWVSFI